MGSITHVTIKNNKKISLDQQFFWYNGNGVNCTLQSDVSSGVYVFNPLNDVALPLKIATTNIIIYKGKYLFQLK